VFAELQLRRPGSTAIDVPALLRGVEAEGVLTPLAEALYGVITALVALADPRLIVLGGSWGTHPAVVQAVVDRPVAWSRPIPIRAARIASEAPLAGARDRALHDLRAAILMGTT
jgi:predicted NBD/HSP70 family sugar kinase